MKKALITGITGQDGSYLAELLLEKGYHVYGLQRRSSLPNTSRIDHLYDNPTFPHFYTVYGDLADSSNLAHIIARIQPDEIYNLGAQSHVRVSFDVPEYTANVTGLGSVRLLEAVRHLKLPVRYYQASSSEMFGKVLAVPQNETTPFNPQSPYGISKTFAFWITRAYREGYGIFASNGILFNHECLTGQVPVLIRKRDVVDIVPIEEIVPHREHPRHGIKYTTVSNSELEVWDGSKWTKVKTLTATWNKASTRKDKFVKRVICRGGYYEATADHISFLQGGKEIQTSKLQPGDHLELKSFPPLNQKIVMTVEEAEFLGMMVADGYVSSDGSARFINNNKTLRDRMQELWQQVAGGFSREDKHPSGFNKRKMVDSVEFAGNRDYLRFIWKELYTQKLFKRIPKRILNANTDVSTAFLRGYNQCDGLKAGHQKTEFKSFTTNSPTLALGLWYLVSHTLNLRVTLHPEFRKDYIYFHLNLNSNHGTRKGNHLIRDVSEIKSIKDYLYTGWLFDLETESGTFSAGVGLTWVHNSPRRGVTFVTRKITLGLARVRLGLQRTLALGNLNAKRDWGFSKDYVEAIWLILQHEKPDDFVIATGQTHTVREFTEEAGRHLGMEIIWEGEDLEEKGIDQKTGKVVVEVDPAYFRPTEVEMLQGDSTKARTVLGWQPKVTFKQLAHMMAQHDYDIAKRELITAQQVEVHRPQL